MLPTFLIMLREGLEAALIVGIIAGYLGRTGRAEWLPAVWVGVLLAVALSLFVGAGVLALGAQFPQKTQELFEALVGLLAVVVLLSMVLWMRKAAKSLSRTMEHDIDIALSHGRGATWALIGMTFFAVAREGLESVFFLLALFQQSPGTAAPLGALLGVAVAVMIGYGIYRGGVRINLGRFFRWTGVFIILVAAGLAASVLRNLHEAGLWNHLQQPIWDMTRTLPVQSVLGTVLSGLFGYHDAPVLGEGIAWAMVLAGGLWFFLRPHAETPGHAVRRGA
ncbi:iron transporter [Haematobacter missouriensis]|uniref:Iron transporter n=1 Tax=Haematobacter missouriensis TaxID=366616 RepID=A0A212ASD9_9RHOB|nr:iron uptake transporter permease EfeU [Haematobacter missouriensis]KFI29835.1 iron transporter [Haematobacter missouriensis]OWJ75966.1 iron transporter [Haematobacter missouriensis]OWJ84393.1 iron transporter [Haematobacter missouriensis]